MSKVLLQLEMFVGAHFGIREKMKKFKLQTFGLLIRESRRRKNRLARPRNSKEGMDQKMKENVIVSWKRHPPSHSFIHSKVSIGM